MNIEIRCCCEGRLLGTIDMTEPELFGTPVILGGLPFQYAILNNSGRQIAALKSRHYSEEELRRIPEFKPATFEERVEDARELLG